MGTKSGTRAPLVVATALQTGVGVVLGDRGRYGESSLIGELEGLAVVLGSLREDERRRCMLGSAHAARVGARRLAGPRVVVSERGRPLGAAAAEALDRRRCLAVQNDLVGAGEARADGVPEPI